MFDLLLRRARLVDDTLTDIAIRDGKIAALCAGRQLLRQRGLD